MAKAPRQDRLILSWLILFRNEVQNNGGSYKGYYKAKIS